MYITFVSIAPLGKHLCRIFVKIHFFSYKVNAFKSIIRTNMRHFVQDSVWQWERVRLYVSSSCLTYNKNVEIRRYVIISKLSWCDKEVGCFSSSFLITSSIPHSLLHSLPNPLTGRSNCVLSVNEDRRRILYIYAEPHHGQVVAIVRDQILCSAHISHIWQCSHAIFYSISIESWLGFLA